jgi:Flp pilus assembly CpaF family ATPase
MNFSRLIVGEVRGEEVLPMLEAVSTGGKGSICTIHANGARHAFERIVSLCLSRAGMNEVFAYRLAAGAISYVVNVAMIDYSIGNQDGARHRFVDQIVEVSGIGEMGRPNYTDIFAPGPDLRGAPAHPPTSARLPVLERAGFDRGWINSGDGMWSKPAPALPSAHGSRA